MQPDGTPVLRRLYHSTGNPQVTTGSVLLTRVTPTPDAPN